MPAEKKVITPEMIEATRPLAKLHLKEDLEKVSYLICDGLEAGGLATFGTAGHIVPPEGKLWNGKTYEPKETVKHAEFPVTPGGATWLFNRYDSENAPSDEPDTEFLPGVETEKAKGKFGSYTKAKLDLKRLEEGLAIWIQRCPKHYSDWVREQGDFFTADSFLQCCMFGDIVYG